MKTPRLILLPGMDGTGDLFAPLIQNLGASVQTQVVSLPTQNCMSYLELIQLVRESYPKTGDWYLLAESFSGPTALGSLQVLSNPPLGLLLCSTFVTSPLAKSLSFPLRVFSKFLFKRKPPEWAVKRFLLGSDASPDLVESFFRAIARDAPVVMSHRLRSISRVDARNWLKDCTAPIHYLRARDDRLVKMSSLEVCMNSNSHIKATEINGPHLILQSRPQESAAWIKGVLSTRLGKLV